MDNYDPVFFNTNPMEKLNPENPDNPDTYVPDPVCNPENFTWSWHWLPCIGLQ